MIASTISNASQFRDEFHRCGRGSQFSYEGLEILFNYLDELSDDIGEPIEMDVIAFCCEYAEQDAASIASDYNIEIDENENDEEITQQVIDHLTDEGVFIGSTDGGSIVYRQF